MITDINNENKFAIRFGLGAIKAVGLKMMETAVNERKTHGKFIDIFDFCSRLDPKAINKKSIEALAKSGAFDSLNAQRNQIADSFDILSAFAQQLHEAKTSNQMSLFGSATESVPKPNLKQTKQWTKFEKLQKEFESFGFFLNEHPLDDNISNLKKRGVIFSNQIDNDDIEDNCMVKMAGVVLASKHRSSARGRFAYLTLSDPYGIFEVMIFDEALITNSRDLIENGSIVAIECLIRKDVGGSRIMIKAVSRLDDFIKNVKANEKDFLDIKKIKIRKNNFKTKEPYPIQQSSDSTINKNTSSPNLQKTSEKIDKYAKTLALTISNKSIIEPIKIILQQKLCLDTNSAHICQIFLIINHNGQTNKYLLPDLYKIKEIDIIRFKNFNQNLQVEFEYY